MTVRMYAARKGWPLERVRVTLRNSRIHAKDCVECETTSGWIHHIDRDIELAGDLDDAQRQRLFHIAERCPIHQTLTSEVNIATSLHVTAWCLDPSRDHPVTENGTAATSFFFNELDEDSPGYFDGRSACRPGPSGSIVEWSRLRDVGAGRLRQIQVRLHQAIDLKG